MDADIPQAGYRTAIQDLPAIDAHIIIEALKRYVIDADESQIRAWRDSIHILKGIIARGLVASPEALNDGTIIFEYTIPLESRRIDVVLLLRGCVIVLEFKGGARLTQGYIDQAAAYARDLRAYHKECANQPVHCLLVLTQAHGVIEVRQDLHIVGPDAIMSSLQKFVSPVKDALDPNRFLSLDSYQPLPSLIKAARELFRSGSLTRIHRAAVATEPTLATCSKIVHKTAQARRRALILICGVPGAGKTLVGLQLAHAKYLDDLAIARANGEKPTAPAVFLSGNGPLVEVLQYELKSAGGDGKAFVRGVHEYVKTFTRRAESIPPQHVLIYDEAQRAFDAAQVDAKHHDMPAEFRGLSEPELFIQFAERVPEWCVVVGLIGSGQEIHIGEEAGLGQWKSAIEKAKRSAEWDVYIPSNPDVIRHFEGLANREDDATLELSVTIRFHLATRLYDFVENLLDGNAAVAYQISRELEANGFTLRLTHDLALAKRYLTERYTGHSEARYGVVASAKDKELPQYGIPKGYMSPHEVTAGKYGKWYAEPHGHAGSCTSLETVATEFAAQGLELDACLLAWGTDFIREDGQWTNKFASKYQQMSRILDAKALRKNAYRVLLTRGRDGCVVFVPPIPEKMRETYAYLKHCGFTELDSL